MIAATINEILTNNTALTALVDDKIYPHAIEQKVNMLPVVCYTIDEDKRIINSTYKAKVLIFCYGKTLTQAGDVADAVEAGFNINCATIVNRQSQSYTIDGTDITLYAYLIEVSYIH